MDAALNLPTPPAPMDPFRAHILALLSIYELGPSPFPGTPIPRYEGPTDWQTESIFKSLGGMAHRMYSAEETVGDLRKQLECEISSPSRPNMTRAISLDSLPYNDSDPFTVHRPMPMTPIVIPPILAAEAFESGMSAVEELRLLKAQVSDLARVCNAVARGDLGQMVTAPVQGVVMVQIKDIVNTMVDKLGQFAREIIRISKGDGTEGKIGEQAVVLDVEGTWQELIGVFNKLATNLAG